MKVKMLQSNMAIRVKRPKSENVTVKHGKQILVTMIARISRDQKVFGRKLQMFVCEPNKKKHWLIVLPEKSTTTVNSTSICQNQILQKFLRRIQL